MKQYEVTDLSITFGIGMVLQLNDRQAMVRKHALSRKHGDLFMVKPPVQFKRGEVIGVAVKGQLSRDMETRLRLVERKNEKKPKHQHTQSNVDEATKATQSTKTQANSVESNHKTKSSKASG